MIYVLVNLKYAYALVDSGTSDIAEFSADEIILLDKFANVVGCEESGIREGVVVAHWTERGYRLESWLNLNIDETALSGAEIDAMKGRGYYIVDNFKSVFERFCSPRLMLARGIRVLVTDRGRLLYLDALQKPKVILGDFCQVVNPEAFCDDCIYTTFILDDRVKSIPFNFGVNVWNKYVFDITALSDLNLLRTMRELKTQGYVDLIG